MDPGARSTRAAAHQTQRTALMGRGPCSNFFSIFAVLSFLFLFCFKFWKNIFKFEQIRNLDKVLKKIDFFLNLNKIYSLIFFKSEQFFAYEHFQKNELFEKIEHL
jgi:hypothetical protein